MARGDECKTATKASYAVKHSELASSVKKPASTPTSYSAPKKPQQNFGAWGPVFKDKKNFTEMHFC